MAAVRWSAEHVVAEYRDLQASCMAVDFTGQYAVLASKRALAIVDLDEPSDSLRKVSRHSKWEVGSLQCNPHISHSSSFVLASNQIAEVMEWQNMQVTTKAVLKGHTRVISDLEWSPFDPNMLATCSADTFTFLWDLRDTRKPSMSLQAVAGSSQIKWNKVCSNLIATAHDTDIRIWDPRKQSAPVQYIAGHLSKIHGLDWSPHNEYNLASSSQDCTVKFWNCEAPKRAEAVLSSSSPVWRARYTPFGQGLVSVNVPQLRRGENSLFLWVTDDLTQPVHTFVGHSDVVLEFQWRKKLESAQDYQLVTWSRDQSLRIWKIEPFLQRQCGHDVLDISGDLESLKPAGDDEFKISLSDEDDSDQLGLTISCTPTDQPIDKSGSSVSPHQPRTLQQEFSLVNLQIPNVIVDELDALQRTCTVTACSGNHQVKLIMNFPAQYPNKALPSFQFGKPTTINKQTQIKLIKILRDASSQRVKRNRSCLEPCLRLLVSSLENLTLDDRSPKDSDSLYNMQSSRPFHRYGAFQDASVPFPRTSGARFCGAGYLVCFRRPVGLSQSAGTEITPKSLSALGAFSQNPMRSPTASIVFSSRVFARDNDVSISNFYKRKSSSRTRSTSRIREDSVSHTMGKTSNKIGPISVTVYDVACLMPINRQLAETYVIDNKDIPSMCQANASAAAAVGRKDLVQMWSLVGLTSSKSLKPNRAPDYGAPWAYHPFGRKLLNSFIQHYSRIHDVQTLAMLCCALSSEEDKNRRQKLISTGSNNSLSQWDVVPANYNPYHTFHGCDSLKGWIPTSVKIRRANSSSDLFDDLRFEDKKSAEEIEKERHGDNMLLLDPKNLDQYDLFKLAYANILYRWGLISRRAEVLKYYSVTPEQHKGIEFVSVCMFCRAEFRGAQCAQCKKFGFQCSICHIAVKGSSNFCLSCGHGGHSLHICEWFRTHSVCPTGCGCLCKTNNISIYSDS